MATWNKAGVEMSCAVVFFNDTATTEIYTLSLHDALPISGVQLHHRLRASRGAGEAGLLAGEHEAHAAAPDRARDRDRKSTRLNSSHANISYAVFCLKKKKGHTLPRCLRLPHSPHTPHCPT